MNNKAFVFVLVGFSGISVFGFVFMVLGSKNSEFWEYENWFVMVFNSYLWLNSHMRLYLPLRFGYGLYSRLLIVFAFWLWFVFTFTICIYFNFWFVDSHLYLYIMLFAFVFVFAFTFLWFLFTFINCVYF